MKRSQTAMEYVFLVAGALFFVTFIIVALRSGIIPASSHKLGQDAGAYFNATRNYLFFDNFDAGQASRWTNYSGNWNVVDRKYVSEAPGSRLSLAGATLSNFSYSAWMKSAGSAGIVFRAEDEGTYYEVLVEGSGIALHSYSGGVAVGEADISSDSTGLASGLTLTVNASGSSGYVFVNGQPVGAMFTLPAPNYRDRGLFGLAAAGASDAEFDDVRVCAQSC